MINEASIDSPVPSHRLYSVGQITFATFAASPLAGCLLLTINYLALQKSRAAWQSLIWGLISTIILLGIAAVLPENFPRFVLPLACSVAMRSLVSYLQGDAIKSHLGSGGKQGSWWITVGLSVGVVLLLFAMVVGGIVLYANLG